MDEQAHRYADDTNSLNNYLQCRCPDWGDEQKPSTKVNKAIHLLAAAKTFRVFEDEATDYLINAMDEIGIDDKSAKKLMRAIISMV